MIYAAPTTEKPYALHHGDCLEALRTLPDCSVDAIVTDPPYGLKFMNKRWDCNVPSVEVWQECLRVLKPGGHLLSFAGTRTHHRMASNIEDAGFEIRDMIAWVYGSGFPKSLDVSKAIDKAAGAERAVLSNRPNSFGRKPGGGAAWGEAITGEAISDHVFSITAPATDAARQWQGWGTALKPALEPVTMARKPLIGTVAANVLEHGTGAVNVDACRVAFVSENDQAAAAASQRACRDQNENRTCYGNFDNGDASLVPYLSQLDGGRWPANFIHDGSEEPSTALGSAARFFYCAKASKRDRDEGCEGMDLKRIAKLGGSDNARDDLDPVSERFRTGPGRNHHPTVKPTDLMAYLCRLVTPPRGVVLDPFAGSGSTGKAAMLEGFRFIGIEREAEYIAIARNRIENAMTTRGTP